MIKFQFGDRVYFPSNVEEIGIVIQVLNSENKIVVAWNDGEQTTEAIDDVQLTIIPHPDTARLDYLIDMDMEINRHDDTTGGNSIGFFQFNSRLVKFYKAFYTEDLREAIDEAMKCEYECVKFPRWIKVAIEKSNELGVLNENLEYATGFSDGVLATQEIFIREFTIDNAMQQEQPNETT